MKFWYNPNFLAVIALLILSAPALKNLATPGFYTSHDGETHTARIAAYYQSILDGQIPPRWAQSFYMGLGSPIFVYIYPAPYLFGSVIHAVGFSFADSFKVIMGLGFILSGVFFYLWLNEVFKSSKAAFLGALFYMWAPYRFSLIYVRASISEVLAYTFLPLAFYSLTKLKEKGSLTWIAISAISVALLLLSQNLVAAASLPIIGIYVLILSFSDKSFRYFLKSTLAIIWGFAISAVTYLPSFFERGFVQFSQIIKVAYENHFVTLGQIIHSPWGYGFDMPGTVNDQMSFQIGLAHLLVLVLAILLLVCLLLKNFKAVKTVSPVLPVFFLITVVVSVFLILDIPQVREIWLRTKLSSFIDIPWRFLGIATFAISFLAAFVAKRLKPGFIFLLLVAAVVVANRNHLRINETRILDDNFFRNYTGHATQYGEFTPKWRQSTKTPIGFDPKIKAEVISGQADINNILSKSNKVSFSADVKSPASQVRINKFYFPGAQVEVDGKKLVPFNDLIVTSPQNLNLDKEQDSSGLMLVSLGEGSHQITAKFAETPLRLFADYLSFTSFAFALLVIAKNAKKYTKYVFVSGQK